MRLSLSQVAVAMAAALLLLSGLNPDHFPPWTSFHTEAPAFVAAALLLVACAGRPTRVGLPALVLAVVVATAWLQWATGLVMYVGDAWVVSAYLIAFASAWLWAAESDGTPSQVQPLDLVIAVLMLLGLLTAFQSIAQWLQLETNFPGWLYAPSSDRATGNLGQPNQAATLLMMGIAAGAALVVQRRIGLLVGWLWFLLAGWAVVLTQSRTGLLSATIMVVAFVVLGAVRPALRHLRWHAIAWLAALFAGAWLLQAVHWAWARGAVGSDVMTSVGLRPVLWRQLVAAVVDSPWVGYGWLQVGTAQQAGSAHVSGIEQVNYSHNIVLDGLVMLGVPLALALFVLGGRWLLERVRRLPGSDGTATAALFMLVPFGVHSMLELPHAYAYFLVPAGALFGIVASRTRGPAEVNWVLPRPALAIAGALSLALLGALATEYASVEEDFRVNRFENRKLGHTPDDYAIPHLRLLTQFEGLLKAMRLRAVRNMAPRDIETLVMAARRYTWAPLEFRAALALALNGRPAEARQHLALIKAMFPPDIYAEGRSNWLLQAEQYPELSAVPPP